MAAILLCPQYVESSEEVSQGNKSRQNNEDGFWKRNKNHAKFIPLAACWIFSVVGMDYENLYYWYQSQKLGKIFTGSAYKLLLSFTVISDPLLN